MKHKNSDRYLNFLALHSAPQKKNTIIRLVNRAIKQNFSHLRQNLLNKLKHRGIDNNYSRTFNNNLINKCTCKDYNNDNKEEKVKNKSIYIAFQTM